MVKHGSAANSCRMRAAGSARVAGFHTPQQEVASVRSTDGTSRHVTRTEQTLHGTRHLSTSDFEPITRRALGLSTLAALGSVMAARPSQAALVEDIVSMQVFDEACQSVVSIINYKVTGGVQVAEGVGTGVVWDSFGHVVTNYHVISKVDKSMISQATKVVITDASGGHPVECSVELCGSDAMHDLAVLKIVETADGSPLPLQPVKLGRSSELKVGQYVFAIGNTFGLTRTMSAGIVSGLNRSIPSPVGTRIYGAIQTDASISAGNSGGPLLDSSARMVGLNTATFTRSGTGRGSGVNFALPADVVLDVVPKLIVYGNALGRKV